jgi:hypothetical protein
MAIALDTSKDLGDNGSVGVTLTTSYTNNGNILFVSVTGEATDRMSGVTYAGVSMTQVSGSPIQTPSDRFAYLFFLLNPATGANNVVVTLTGGGNTFIAGLAASYSGANGGVDLGGNTSGSSISSLSKSLTTTIDNDWTIAYFAANGGVASAGASTTLRKASVSFPQFSLFDSNAALTPPGSKTLNVNVTATPNASMIMAAFAPLSSGHFLSPSSKYW